MEKVVKRSAQIMLLLSLSYLILDSALDIVDVPDFLLLPSLIVYWFILGYEDYVHNSKVWGRIIMIASTTLLIGYFIVVVLYI
ncbi:hypothetical protein LCM20_09430 [Halobacillus litoralis]|uniref:hypothetical protein n=1 Tax=Halobacillus litoralis TaxID=45668 RepID=UPI001CD5FD68|nr:hypothetical protein [Halobacillus litoralis]MCA0970810.1 hypothetical protein [Halobacillus litoralis]